MDPTQKGFMRSILVRDTCLKESKPIPRDTLSKAAVLKDRSPNGRDPPNEVDGKLPIKEIDLSGKASIK